MKCLVLWIVLTFASKNENDAESVAANLGEKIMENPIVVKIEEDESAKKKSKSSNYFGVSYHERPKKWTARRWSTCKKKLIFNGAAYGDEETAAHASDTLARQLILNGEDGHKLNFPDDNVEVHPEQTKTSSKYFGVSYCESYKKWVVQRWSKTKKMLFTSGAYKDEETAAHASDTLARKLIENGGHYKLNFPNDNTEVHAKTKTKSSHYFGVYYIETFKTWIAQRWSRTEKRHFKNGTFKNEETAAHASDTLARELMANGEEGHKLNFPEDKSEVHAKTRAKTSEFIGVIFNEKVKSWSVSRWSKAEKKTVYSGYYKDEETAAHASDTLASKLMEDGGQNLKLNFPEQLKQQNTKRKRSFDFDSQTEKFEEKEK